MTIDYVFGYGSLINPESRARTASSGQAIPIEVRGYQRAWNCICCKLTDYTFRTLQNDGTPKDVLGKLSHLKDKEFLDRKRWREELTKALNKNELSKFSDTLFGQAFLGVYEKEGAVTKGVLVPVSSSAIPEFDRREDGYTRQRLQTEITPLYGQEMPVGNLWIYVPDIERQPEIDCPIVQSYVDVILYGCFIEFGRAFAREFVCTTELWEYDWVDDRHDPVYPGAVPYVPFAMLIDRVLAEGLSVSTPSAKRVFQMSLNL